MTRDQSIRSAARNHPTAVRVAGSTPASCQGAQPPPATHPRLNRTPISLGSRRQGIPDRSTNKMPVSALRSSSRLRPALYLRTTRLGRRQQRFDQRPGIRLSVSVWPSPPPRETRQRPPKEIKGGTAPVVICYEFLGDCSGYVTLLFDAFGSGMTHCELVCATNRSGCRSSKVQSPWDMWAIQMVRTDHILSQWQTWYFRDIVRARVNFSGRAEQISRAA